MKPAFVPGKSRKAFIFELDVGEEYLERNPHREIHFIEYGSKHLAIEHTALVPKGRFPTVAMIGKCIDRAALPQIERILPGIQAAPLACACAPRMAVTPARSPFGDRFAIIGDAAGARLNKDGLFSAHLMAGRAAFTKPVVSRITYQAYATECKVREMRGYGVLRSILAGAAVTLRNVALKALFGLKWGEYGRYPRVVLKEKREVLKEQLASSLGRELGEAPEFERMYAIKIRGAAEEIMVELAQFGDSIQGSAGRLGRGIAAGREDRLRDLALCTIKEGVERKRCTT